MPPLRGHPLSIPLLAAGLALNAACIDDTVADETADETGDETNDDASDDASDGDGDGGDGDGDGALDPLVESLVGQWNITHRINDNYCYCYYGTWGDECGDTYTSDPWPHTWSEDGCTLTDSGELVVEEDGLTAFRTYRSNSCESGEPEQLDSPLGLTIKPISEHGFELVYDHATDMTFMLCELSADDHMSCTGEYANYKSYCYSEFDYEFER